MLCLGFYTLSATAQLKVITNGDVGVGGIEPTQTLDVNGNMQVRGTQLLIGKDAGAGIAIFRLGAGRTADGAVGFDFIADQSNYAQYGDRFLRSATGISIFSHRGTNPLRFRNEQAAELQFFIQGLSRMVIKPTTGNVGIGLSNPSAKLHVTGDIMASGSITTSDRRLKKDIKKYDGGIEKLMKIQPYTYHYNGEGGISNDKLQFGIMAQELEKIEPEAVGTYVHELRDEEGNLVESDEYKYVQTGAIQYMLVNAIREQQAIIQKQNKRIGKLEKMIGLKKVVTK